MESPLSYQSGQSMLEWDRSVSYMCHICDTIVTRENARLESLLQEGIQGVGLTLLKRTSHFPVQAGETRTSKNTKRRFENEVYNKKSFCTQGQHDRLASLQAHAEEAHKGS